MVLEKHFRDYSNLGDLRQSKRILLNFDQEVQIIKSKFKSVGYPLPFTDNAICAFEENNIGGQNKVTQ